jgi:outer membrane protein TolC
VRAIFGGQRSADSSNSAAAPGPASVLSPSGQAAAAAPAELSALEAAILSLETAVQAAPDRTEAQNAPQPTAAKRASRLPPVTPSSSSAPAMAESVEPVELPAPTGPASVAPASSVDETFEQPISLASALATTAGQNPQVNFARQRIAEALAGAQAAEVLWLPSLRAGANYNKHEGRIQDVVGDMIETSRTSVYTGLGAQAVGAGSPAVPGLLVDLHVRDALFQPQIATQTLGARRQESRAVTNDLLLETAVAYIDLLEAMQIRAIAGQVLLEAQSLADTTLAFAEAGQGLQSDADRSRAEVAFRQIDVRRADEAVRLASVRLARLLRADQNATLAPIEPVLVPIELIDADQPLLTAGNDDRVRAAPDNLRAE